MLGIRYNAQNPIDRYYLLMQVVMKEGFPDVAQDLPLNADCIKV